MPQESTMPGFCIGASSLADFAGIGVGADFSIDRIRSRLPPCAKISAKRLQIDDAVAGKHAGTGLPGDFKRNESHGLNIALVNATPRHSQAKRSQLRGARR